MTRSAIKLNLLERVVSAPDQRQLAEASLAAFREIAPGDHFSAILFDLKTHKVADYYLDQSWLAANDGFWQAAQHQLTAHPLAQRFLAQQQSMTLVRSRVVPDPLWKKTWLYNEVERPLGVEDLASVCQITAPNQAVIITCGRSRRFSDRDLAPIQSFQRILSSLVPFRCGTPKQSCPPPGACRWGKVPGPLAKLTAREREILHWVREGKRDPEIGIILDLSPRTVQHHLENVYRKLGVETRTAAAFVQ